jgi:hypothetical protein
MISACSFTASFTSLSSQYKPSFIDFGNGGEAKAIFMMQNKQKLV